MNCCEFCALVRIFNNTKLISFCFFHSSNSEEEEENNTEQKEGSVEDSKSEMSPSDKVYDELTDRSFSSLKDRVSEETLMAIEEMGFTTMTAIQSKSIAPLLDGRDLVGAAKTGSGKTLAFLIPGR